MYILIHKMYHLRSTPWPQHQQRIAGWPWASHRRVGPDSRRLGAQSGADLGSGAATRYTRYVVMLERTHLICLNVCNCVYVCVELCNYIYIYIIYCIYVYMHRRHGQNMFLLDQIFANMIRIGRYFAFLFYHRSL